MAQVQYVIIGFSKVAAANANAAQIWQPVAHNWVKPPASSSLGFPNATGLNAEKSSLKQLGALTFASTNGVWVQNFANEKDCLAILEDPNSPICKNCEHVFATVVKIAD